MVVGKRDPPALAVASEHIMYETATKHCSDYEDDDDLDVDDDEEI